ncbi:Spectrin beta chain, non-erythrocytic 1, variant 3 [Entomophthora muscae]|uniref:Spectrin beta chain, non-erythrocytic 1, variant 3 n=1 Tax=Entomophthora muscae TaxID=34485 RepID=A0ACC2SYM5_9FUNG|nr:Spectrin beta chain, non-erythrocytic 1, variant 3 [Entomophthora muscae]
MEPGSLDSLDDLFVGSGENLQRLPSLTLPPSSGLSSTFAPESYSECGSSMLSLAESNVLKDELSSLHISYAQFNQLYLGDDDARESFFDDSHIFLETPGSPILEDLNLNLAKTTSSHESSSSSCHSQAALALEPSDKDNDANEAEEPQSPEEVHEVGQCAQDVEHEGALSIKSERCESGVLTSTKHWKQFWVVVQAGALLVYKDQKSKKFKGWYDLMSASVTPAAKGQSKKRFVFSLSTSTGLPPALFQASDAVSFDRWLNQLKAAIEAHPPGRQREPMVISLPRQTSPPKPRKTKIIGKLFNRPDRRPEDSVWGSLIGDSDNVAYVVKRCVEELVTRCCFKQEGLYRLSGNATSIKTWKDKFSTLGPVSLSSESDNNVITGVLKLYFRELAEPLIPYPAYYAILDAARKPLKFPS